VSLEDVIAAAVVDELERRGSLPPAGTSQPEVEPWRLLTLDEAAERLGRSPRWVRQRKEAIGYVRLDGGALAFRLEDLQRSPLSVSSRSQNAASRPAVADLYERSGERVRSASGRSALLRWPAGGQRQCLRGPGLDVCTAPDRSRGEAVERLRKV
jgi:hypothetical protein